MASLSLTYGVNNFMEGGAAPGDDLLVFRLMVLVWWNSELK